MPKQSVRAMVRAGRFEPLESVPFLEGAEVMVTGEVPDDHTAKMTPRTDWPVRKLGIKEPVRRTDIYEDIG